VTILFFSALSTNISILPESCSRTELLREQASFSAGQTSTRRLSLHVLVKEEEEEENELYLAQGSARWDRGGRVQERLQTRCHRSACACLRHAFTAATTCHITSAGCDLRRRCTILSPCSPAATTFLHHWLPGGGATCSSAVLYDLPGRSGAGCYLPERAFHGAGLCSLQRCSGGAVLGLTNINTQRIRCGGQCPSVVSMVSLPLSIPLYILYRRT